jgi:antitoxin PrlF
MELARITAKGQVTIPKRIRDAAHIREGNRLSFDFDSNNRIIIKLMDSPVDVELLALQQTLSEWNSSQDDESWREL